MCGIAGILGSPDESRIRRILDAQAHRGTAGRTIWTDSLALILGHDRLDGVVPQPAANADGSLRLLMDGELFNYQELRQELEGRYTFASDSDAEVALHLFAEYGLDFLNRLDGSFAIALWEPSTGLLLARDPLGIKPLYWGRDRAGNLLFASEIKSLVDEVEQVQELAQGHFWQVGSPAAQYEAIPQPRAELIQASEAVAQLDEALTQAVAKRLDSHQQVGCFLSGGLDSSLVAAMMQQQMGGDLHTFAVGMADSEDLANARLVAQELGTIHHERVLTEAEVTAALPEVIDQLESCDAALVRSAIPTFFVSETAAQTVGVVLSGEGADELFGGYQYLEEFDPDASALEQELYRITEGMHNSGLQRVDRMTGAHGLAARLPLLDRDVVRLAFRMAPSLKRRQAGSKWVLRKVAERYLPASIVWRTKEKFSIGTGVSTVLERFAASTVAEDDLSRARSPRGTRFRLKEEFLYWSLFKGRYGRSDVLACMGRSRSLDPEGLWIGSV